MYLDGGEEQARFNLTLLDNRLLCGGGGIVPHIPIRSVLLACV